VVQGALQALARRRRFRLLVIGLDDYRLEGVDVECRPWRSETEVEDLWPIDVGIMPLSDDPWARGKCAMKAIQYMGVGLPTVVSPVGANAEVVEHGVTGFLAQSDDEWVHALQRLMDDGVLRRRLGQEGRLKVERVYSAEAQAPRLAAVLRTLVA
jgi:glycosyltransferase involved in cell wall biosynthesis